MAMAYFARAAADNVVHAELFFDPQTHTDARRADRHRDRRPDARVRARRPSSASTRALILCFLRHLSEEAALATLEEALPYRDKFIGVGLDSSERGHPPEKFARVFARCRRARPAPRRARGRGGAAGLHREALDVLHVERIDHGVRCLEDPALVARLARERMPLTVCPLSNVKLCVYPTARASTTSPTLLDAGLCATVNSDDPAYFGGYIERQLPRDLRGAAAARRRATPTRSRATASRRASSQRTKKRGWIDALDAAFASA